MVQISAVIEAVPPAANRIHRGSLADAAAGVLAIMSHVWTSVVSDWRISDLKCNGTPRRQFEKERVATRLGKDKPRDMATSSERAASIAPFVERGIGTDETDSDKLPLNRAELFAAIVAQSRAEGVAEDELGLLHGTVPVLVCAS